MSVTIGWWALPLTATLVVSVWAWMWCAAEPPGGDYTMPMRWVVALPVWLIVTLGSWLIWALFR